LLASRDGPVSVKESLDRLLSKIEPDAEALCSVAEIEHCREIVTGGSSADAQLREAAGSEESLVAVKRWITATTSDSQ
jgi:gamma-glutamyl:cysteine ligase YbdK (ATP-grasp superfamily)